MEGRHKRGKGIARQFGGRRAVEIHVDAIRSQLWRALRRSRALVALAAPKECVTGYMGVDFCAASLASPCHFASINMWTSVAVASNRHSVSHSAGHSI